MDMIICTWEQSTSLAIGVIALVQRFRQASQTLYEMKPKVTTVTGLLEFQQIILLTVISVSIRDLVQTKP